MKYLQLFLFFCLVTTLSAQLPDKFSFQSVIRDANNNLLANSTVGCRIAILQGSSNGNELYAERHTATTNTNGLLMLEVGSGSATTGSFNTIPWHAGPFFIKVETDLSGGFNYTLSMTSELLSVPFALYAKKAANGFNHHIGEFFEGGIIFHLYKDQNQIEHGLIVSIEDLAANSIWSNITNAAVGPSAESTWNGQSNTASVITQAGHTQSAALLCENYSSGGFSDWYLPSIDELNLIYNQRYDINRALSVINNSDPLLQGYYWSSMESSPTNAWRFSFFTGSTNDYIKSNTYSVRAVRSF